MKNALRILVFLGLFIAVESTAQSFTPEVQFRNYSTEHGLASAEVYNVFQDELGFLWFSTDNGLSRFDSRQFRNFSAKDGLTDNVVFDLYRDQEGNIWANTMSGRLFNVRHDTIIPFRFNNTIRRFKDGRDHHCGTELTPDGHYYLGMGPKGILHIDPNGVARIITEKDKVIVRGRGVNTLYSSADEPANNKIVFLDRKMSLEVDGHDGMFPYYARLLDEHFFLAYDSTLYHFRGEELSHVKTLPNRSTHVAFVGGRFWIGTLHHGAFMADSPEAFFRGEYTQFLKGLSVTDILCDHEGGFWFTTLERGVFYAPDLEITFLGDNAGLNELSFLSVSMVDEHSYYVMGASRKFYYVNTLERKFQQLPEIPENYYISDIYFCKKQKRLFALGRGLFELENNRWVGLEGILPETFMRGNKRIHSVPDKTQFYLSGKSGFSLYDYEARKLLFVSGDDLVTDWVRVVHRAKNGLTWLGASDGLYMLENNQLNPPKLRDEMLNLRVNDISELPDGRIVMATMGGGILLLDGMNLQKLTEADGLATNMISRVEADSYGRIWAASMRGLHLIRPTEEGWNIRVFGKSDGLPAYEIIDFELDFDNILIATPRGVILCPQSRFLDASNPEPQLVVSEVRVNGNMFHFPTEVTLNPGEKDLSLAYHTISYKYPDNMSYGYKIEGLSDRWMATAGPKLFISDIEKGEYAIVLQSTTGVGSKSKLVRLPLTVNVSFKETTLFYVILAILTTLGMAVLFVSVLKSLRKGDLNEKRLIQLERSALQAQMNPHFIFNALNSIQSYIATSETGKATHFLSKFSRLIRETLNNSMYSTISLKKELETLTVYLELEQMRFKNKFDFTITVDDEINPEKIFIPPLLIQPYLENAIVHGLAQTRAQGRINLYYMLQGDYLVVTVTDNGIGVEASKANKSSHASFHKSVGMTITRQRLELIDRDNTEGKVKVEEIKDRKGEVLGTKVEVMIKYSAEELRIAVNSDIAGGETNSRSS